MLAQIVGGALLLSVCVFLHAVATIAIARFRRGALHDGRTTFRWPVLALAGAFVFIFVLHVFEIAIWAGAYVALGALNDFEQALYFSAVSFTTVGYGDVVLSRAMANARRRPWSECCSLAGRSVSCSSSSMMP
jgi:Ion channel